MLPQSGRMEIIMFALMDCRANFECACNLEKYGFETVLMPPAEYLSAPVAFHTDMLVFSGFGKLFCHSKYYEKNKELIDKISAGYSLFLSDEPTGDSYPNDALFNCVLLGNYLLCNKKTVSQYILSEAKAHGFDVLHTNQGYTKCSVCKISDNAVITSDASIHRVCTDVGIDSLLVEVGHVLLPGYEYGFIGGASGVCGDRVYFCGDINTHPSSEQIKNFCLSHKKEVTNLSLGPLFDCGSILFV